MPGFMDRPMTGDFFKKVTSPEMVDGFPDKVS